MSRLVGETIYILGDSGRVAVPRAVVSPESGTVINRPDGSVNMARSSVLIPLGFSVAPHDRVEVRGVEYRQSRPPETSISPFGTGRGGTEIFLEIGTIGD